MKTALEFWAKVDKSGECWIWRGGIQGRGYGNLKWRGKSMYAHRVSYMLSHSLENLSTDLMHSCDNPPCVNPAHLRQCTHAENMADMARKGRKVGIRGSAHKLSKLTEAQAISIKQDGRPHTIIAKEYGVSLGLIGHIKVGRNWSHI